ncbi:MAG: hypothetical protein II054_04375 [Treponema sp.]|nr:hypothetical protein [Treponema sp.]MBQ2081067.1 hypothetical protein [Treponema sp.]MBR6297148.1 hypothetical protein [Treponema sp.]MEE3312523.1 DUF5312 family protein [Treponema sp.]
MSFFQSISDFFQSIFMASSPEVKQKQALKKIESELKNTNPQIYKDGAILESFAEALRLLFENTKSILDVLSDTICSTDLERNHRFTEQLLMTGFPPEAQDILASLAYETRKEAAREEESISRFFEGQHRQLERAIKYLSAPEFVKIDQVLDNIKQLYDVCKYPYVTVLHIFDPNYSTITTPKFQPVATELVENYLEDLYYVTAGMDVSKSTCNAVVALYKLYNKVDSATEVSENFLANMRKIQSLMKHVFTADNLRNLVRISKKDPSYEPKKALYQENSKAKYADYLENRFQVDSARIKGELQDEKISTELHQLFPDNAIVPVAGYNSELNSLLMQSTPSAFMFTMPMQILKNFIRLYYEDHVKPLLNDIVIEGYFTNPAYKSEFSSYVYAMNETMEIIKNFEEKFQRNGEFDETVINSMIKDSHKDNVFVGRLKELVDKINKTAKDLIQAEVNHVFHVYKITGELMLEAKKAHSDIIENLKVLTLSSRNRLNTETMEKEHGLWQVFLEIMKNYVIISNIEK